MKKQIGLFTAILFAVSTLMMACKVEVHTHKFSSKWTSDETNHWHAATCEHKDEVIDRAEHTFGDWITTKEPTEEAEGSREKTCTVCGYKATESIAKLPHTHKFETEWTSDETNHWHASTCGHEVTEGKTAHTFGDWTITKAATEEAEGSREKSCTVCEYTVPEVIEKLEHTHKFASEWTSDETNHWHAATCGHEVTDSKAAHTFGDWTTTKEPTEEAEGSREKSCTVCEYTVPEVIEKLEHTHKFATDWTKDETNHWHASTCGHTTEVSEKAEHTFGEWTVTKEPTEEAEGSKERTCTVCGYTATKVIEKLAHTHKFTTDWTSDKTNHWHASTCGHEVTEGKTAHTFGEWTITKEPTEEAKGSREKSCTVCEYTVPEVIAKLEHTHKFATEWTSDETNHWHASTCGHEVTEGKTAHTFGDWTTTKEATCTEEGKKTVYCTVCEYEKEETIPAKGHTFGIWEIKTEPTETEVGQMQRECEGCGETETEEIQPVPEGFVLVEAGTFKMGSEKGFDRNKPVHEVTITTPFYMGKYEVTQAEYEKYCSDGGSSPSSRYGDGDNYPAYFVSWYDAIVYCNKRSMAEGLKPCYSISASTDPDDWEEVQKSKWNAATCNFDANGYRLPTEAEWEYAARAGDNTVDSLTYSGTMYEDVLDKYAWYFDNSDYTTHEVGTKLPNAFGLCDMSGNVWEWCWNWFTWSYDTEAEGGSDPTGTSAGSFRVGRGGSRRNNSDYCAVSFRSNGSPNVQYDDYGFRVVRRAN